ncbi:DUF4406 domain-containing protein [Mesorhizobium sp. PAMC28654]|uniref:DUF4406 domain-containing protein n=1 Tax=Mesorhizobium sp. PAMC28654 TaxID=2880934 RepID=UPI001D0A03D4|nr:DUF4406 domain-containing protein [Mesorhizobium sp. PAMC28654]UDL89825.1 DUF4406 domain-containing protein [Mesorhizobium sp. PAMC28654]
MRIYIAGPMRGKPDFNFPAFDKASQFLRRLGHTVFNPADRDRKVHGEDFGKGDGNQDVAVQKGFNLREALATDMKFIAEEADAIWMLEGWETSLGARAEHALATALSLRIFYDCDLPVDDDIEITYVDNGMTDDLGKMAPAGFA